MSARKDNHEVILLIGIVCVAYYALKRFTRSDYYKED